MCAKGLDYSNAKKDCRPLQYTYYHIHQSKIPFDHQTDMLA
jgi:hypothetical protein